MPHTVTHADPGEWPADDLEYLGRCPICNSDRRNLLYNALTDRVFFAAPGSWSLYECVACSCAYLDPRPTRESIMRAYDNYYTHDPSETSACAVHESEKTSLRVQLRNGYLNRRYGHQHANARPSGFYARYLLPPPIRPEWDHHARHLLRPTPGHNRLLDIGCGDGKFMAVADRAGWACEGIDPDPEAVSAARARGLHVTCGNTDSLELPRAKYDVITMNHVLEHLHDPLRNLRAYHKLLRPGGLLWVATPNLNALGHRRYQHAWRGLEPPRHLVLFDHNVLHRSLIDSGFTGIKLLPRGAHVLHMLRESQAILEASNPVGRSPKKYLISPRAQLYEFLAWLKPQYAEEVIMRARKPVDVT